MAKKEVHTEDLPVFDYPAWLAGMFEIGGSMRFDLSRWQSGTSVKVYAYPLMQLTDKKEAHVRTLQRVAGGRIDRLGDLGHPRSIAWQSRSVEAVALAKLMEDFAPSRKRDIVVYRQWEEEPSVERRLDIAKEHRQSTGRLDVETQSYLQLVGRPEFTAGVTDSRGAFFPRYSATTPPKLIIYGSNKSLLDAVQSTHGGAVRINHRQGEVHTTPYGEYAARDNTYRLEISGKKLEDLLSSIAPYLFLHEIFEVRRILEK